MIFLISLCEKHVKILYQLQCIRSLFDQKIFLKTLESLHFHQLLSEIKSIRV